MWLKFKLFWNFLKNVPDYINPSVHFVFYKNFCDSNFYNFFFFSIVILIEKWNVSSIYKSIIQIFQWIFLWYLSTNFITKKFKSNNQENLENNIQVKFDKEHWKGCTTWLIYWGSWLRFSRFLWFFFAFRHDFVHIFRKFSKISFLCLVYLYPTPPGIL